MIVFATGYRQTFPFLHADGQAQMAAQPEPSQAASGARPCLLLSSRRRLLAANTDANADAAPTPTPTPARMAGGCPAPAPEVPRTRSRRSIS